MLLPLLQDFLVQLLAVSRVDFWLALVLPLLISLFTVRLLLVLASHQLRQLLQLAVLCLEQLIKQFCGHSPDEKLNNSHLMFYIWHQNCGLCVQSIFHNEINFCAQFLDQLQFRRLNFFEYKNHLFFNFTNEKLFWGLILSFNCCAETSHFAYVLHCFL